MQYQEILTTLKKLQNPQALAFKKRFGISPEMSHGIFLKDLKILAKKIPKNSQLACELFESTIYEARLLVPLIFNKKDITKELMTHWIQAFTTWEICDTFCMKIFGKSAHAHEMAHVWVQEPGEFQRRAGFACIAAYACTSKDASNEIMRTFFPLILEHAHDERIYVKKAMSWALRQIGKRNKDLQAEAITIAHKLLEKQSKPARWIARDVLRELESPRVCIRHYPR